MKTRVLLPLLVAAIACSLLASPAAAQKRREASGAPAEVLTGLDVLKRDSFGPLKGKKIAIITNHTGRDRDGNHIVELLHKAEGVTIVSLFSPEHGLYGETRRPTDEMLKGIDALVFDIADVGARFYTYSATLGICMEEAAKRNIAFFVLDRPNPITGLIVEGPIADKKYYGFTAYGPMPVAHGMTFGELAQMYKGDFGVSDVDLHIVKMEGWKRDMWFDETGLLWQNPSPNMRNLTQALLYTGVCQIEATNVSVGRGTDQPFELFGAPWIDGKKLSAELNAAKIPGLRAIPIEFTPESSKFKGEKCNGVFLLVTDRNALDPVAAGIHIASSLHKLFGDKFEVDKVVRLLQNDAALAAIKEGKDPKSIPAMWQKDLEQFKKIREKHLIYK